MSKGVPFTKAEDAYIIANFSTSGNAVAFAESFNKAFQYKRGIETLRHRAQRLGVSAPKETRWFTAEEDTFLRDNLQKYRNLYELADAFNAAFPKHETNQENLQKRLKKLGLKKGTKFWREEIRLSGKRLPVGSIIYDNRKEGKGRTRLKTEKGYVSADKWFLEKVYSKSYREHTLIHLNGNRLDFSAENLMCIDKRTFVSMCYRNWFFTDPELTKAAALTAELLLFFPELTHDEDAYYRRKER